LTRSSIFFFSLSFSLKQHRDNKMTDSSQSFFIPTMNQLQADDTPTVHIEQVCLVDCHCMPEMFQIWQHVCTQRDKDRKAMLCGFCYDVKRPNPASDDTGIPLAIGRLWLAYRCTEPNVVFSHMYPCGVCELCLEKLKNNKLGKSRFMRFSTLMKTPERSFDLPPPVAYVGLRDRICEVTGRAKCSSPRCMANEMKGDEEFKACGRCKKNGMKVFYCSVQCQSEHWLHGHKQVCELKQ
jgi:hypothetical protein